VSAGRVGAATSDVAAALGAEADELRAFLEGLPAGAWSEATPFRGWTPWDVVAHLHFFDDVALEAACDPEAFSARRKAMAEDWVRGIRTAEQARRALGGLGPRELLERWHRGCQRLAGTIGERPPGQRIPWFGPDMAARTFLTARLMETWAHGWDVYDMRGVARVHDDRIEPIAGLGVKTYGWTFANRGLPAPGDPPHVRLEAPSGAIWTWHPEDAASRVEGSAVEFCQVVTQVRNVADTGLRTTGEPAARWMEIAQCFAGGPSDPPEPGTRLDAAPRAAAEGGAAEG